MPGRGIRAVVRAVSAASVIRSSGYPLTPTALQNLVTVVSLVPAVSATSVMLRRATPAGSSSTTCATRCSAFAKPGNNERMRTSGLGSVGPALVTWETN
jgi:hypothetical protein